MRLLRLGVPAVLVSLVILAGACNGNGEEAVPPATLVAGVTEPPAATATEAPTLPPGARLSTVEIVRKLRPSVVQVLTEDAARNVFGQIIPTRGIGTGVIIDSDGLIVTNDHVVRAGGVPTGPIAGRITVTLDDGRTAAGEVVGTDPATDLAVVHIDVTGLTPAELGDASSLPVGSELVAMGFALGLEGAPTVTRGVVSATGRTIQQSNINISIPDAIQTDAGINPGNSGGPLVDEFGRVVGINTAIIPGAENIGFAISIDLVKPVTQELIQSGQVARGFLGVGFNDVTPSLAATFGLPAEQGVAITNVVPGSPAEEAGLRLDDIIIGLQDLEIRSSGDLLEALRVHKAGQRVTLRLYRDGEPVEADLTLSERPN